MAKEIWQIPTGTHLKPFPVTVETDGKHFYIYSSYDTNALNEFRALDKGKWDKINRRWVVPINERNIFALKFLSGHRDERYYNNSLYAHYFEEAERFFPQLFPWQKEAFAFIASRKRCEVAYDMGLGKTLTCLAIQTYFVHYGITRWWLVAPYGAQKTWEREAEKWKLGLPFLVTTSYESLHKHIEANEAPQGVIFDEAIKIKNHASQRSQYAAQLCKHMREYEFSFIIPLSGSPAPKTPDEWWHPIECCCPGFIRESNPNKFRNRYADIEFEENEYGKYPVIKSWKDDEVKKLGKRLAPIVIRRSKKECLELPEKIFETIADVPSEEVINVAKLIVKQSETAIQALESLRELSDGFQYQRQDKTLSDRPDSSSYTWVGSPKLSRIFELLDFYHKDNGGPGRLVIYAAFRATIEQLVKEITPFDWTPIRIDGTGWSHKDTLELFENSLLNIVIVANPGSVYGLNFQQTLALVYYSNNFNPGDRIQSMERRDRPGMNREKGTRIVDLIHLETDRLIRSRLTDKLEMQDVTLKEIEGCLC